MINIRIQKLNCRHNITLHVQVAIRKCELIIRNRNEKGTLQPEKGNIKNKKKSKLT